MIIVKLYLVINEVITVCTLENAAICIPDEVIATQRSCYGKQ